MLAITAVVEAASKHPLGRAVGEAALERGVDFPEVANFQAESGRGVTAHIDGAAIRVGSPAFLDALGIDRSALNERVEAAKSIAQSQGGHRFPGRAIHAGTAVGAEQCRQRRRIATHCPKSSSERLSLPLWRRLVL